MLMLQELRFIVALTVFAVYRSVVAVAFPIEPLPPRTVLLLTKLTLATSFLTMVETVFGLASRCILVVRMKL